jgi:poly(hydroxyalkanoate) granule-associated protein
MVTKLQKEQVSDGSGDQAHSAVKDSAQQIWQAGLGAFAKVQAESAKALELLVKDSVNLQRKTKAAADEHLSEATNKITHMATDITAKATGQWDKLENIFEERVAKALNKLGTPTAQDINALLARIDELNLAVQKLSASAPVAKVVAVKKPTKAKVPTKRTV